MNVAKSILQQEYEELDKVISGIGYAIFNGYTINPEEKGEETGISLTDALVTLSECQRERREVLGRRMK